MGIDDRQPRRGPEYGQQSIPRDKFKNEKKSLHHDIVQDSTDDAPQDLDDEVDPRRDLDVLTKLQILQESDALHSRLSTV